MAAAEFDTPRREKSAQVPSGERTPPGTSREEPDWWYKGHKGQSPERELAIPTNASEDARRAGVKWRKRRGCMGQRKANSRAKLERLFDLAK